MFKLSFPFRPAYVVLWPALALFIVFQAGCKKDKPEKDAEFSLSSLYRSHELTTEGYNRFFSFAAASQGDEKKALAETAEWMQQQAGIKDVYISADTYLTAIMEDGLKLRLIINYTDEQGRSLYRGGESVSAGAWMNITDNLPCDNNLPNRKVLLWGAAYSEFGLYQSYPALKNALNASDLDLEVTEMIDEECIAATLKTIDQYGVVIFDTHGFEDGVLTGKRFDLNETITDEVAFRDAIRAAVGIEAYTMLLTGELFTTRTIDVPAAATAAWWQNPVNQVDGGTYKLWASSRFFMQNVGSLSNTVVFNNSCYSGAKRFSGARGARGNTITPEGITVANAILSRSPIAYYGWRFDDETSEKLENGAAILAAENMVDRLVENDSTGLWNLKAGNDEAIIDHFHRRPLVLTHDRHPGYCYEEAACGTFEDPRDGQVYKLACIGGKKWFAENLRFNVPGSKIPDNDPGLLKDYGRLYTWEMVSGNASRVRDDNQLQGICPAGWHIPTRNDVLALFPGMQYDDRQFDRQFIGNVDGNRYKSPKRWLGVDPTISNMNETGFSAMPAGWAYKNESTEYFSWVHQRASFWISNSMMKDHEGNYAKNVDAFHIYNVAAGDRVALDTWISTTQWYSFSCRCVED